MSEDLKREIKILHKKIDELSNQMIKILEKLDKINPPEMSNPSTPIVAISPSPEELEELKKQRTQMMEHKVEQFRLLAEMRAKKISQVNNL